MNNNNNNNVSANNNNMVPFASFKADGHYALAERLRNPHAEVACALEGLYHHGEHQDKFSACVTLLRLDSLRDGVSRLYDCHQDPVQASELKELDRLRDGLVKSLRFHGVDC